MKHDREPRAPSPSRRFLLGLACLLVAAACSAALASAAWSGGSLPGCGPRSACERASAGPWGRLPVLGWSTAELGLAFFGALACAWTLARGELGRTLRWIARAGALISLVFVVVLLVERAPCPYCIAVHAANLTFVALCVRGTSAGRRVAWPAFLLAFGLASALVLLAGARRRESERVRTEREVARTTAEVAARAEARVAASTEPAGAPFTGRWRLGPELARVRIVAFSDYQCPDCKRVEGELQLVLQRHPDVSLSAKHYPFCSECNDVARALSFSPHPNACRAARLAEAAGMLGGERAFWSAHRWLFEHDGAFDAQQVEELAGDLGLQGGELRAAMEGETSLAHVRSDIAEGTELGLHMTPMVFLNGTELGAWTHPGAIAQAVDALVASELPPQSATADRAPSAASKYFQDWIDAARRPLATRDRHHWMQADAGPALVDVVVWGDYEEQNTRALHRELASLMLERPGLRYSFRHYPLDRACNALATKTLHPGACVAARVAEAAGHVGGTDAFWRMHRWLMEHGERDAPALRAAFAELGLDVESCLMALREPGVRDAPREDAEDGAAAGLTSVPYLLVDGRHVPRWHLEGDEILARILDHALERARSEQRK